MSEEKKKDNSSVFLDIAKQTRDEILIPRLLDTANTAASQTIYGIADYFDRVFAGIMNSVARKIFKVDRVPVVTKNRSDRGKYSTQARTNMIEQNLGLRSSANLEYIVIKSNDPNDRLDETDIDGRKKAEKIKNALISRFVKYGNVRVGDLYEYSGKKTPVNTDYHFGWTNINDIHYTRNSDGWWFNMPSPTRLD